MKIIKVSIPEDGTDGLGAIKMDRLGQVVLIAGKNGSGKSRILNKIVSTISQKPGLAAVDEANKQVNDLPFELESHRGHLAQSKEAH